jgi:hypothetical protein
MTQPDLGGESLPLRKISGSALSNIYPWSPITYYARMTSRVSASLIIGVLLTYGCGSETHTAQEPGQGLGDGQVAFVGPGSNAVFGMDTDGSNVYPLTLSVEPVRPWPNQRRILNGACDPSFGNSLDDPIELVSPDGVSLGRLDESWTPEWSPVEDIAAVACARGDDGIVVIVSNVEMPGTGNGWSRNGRAELSDRVEILLISYDGSEVTQRTRNEAGDWLPRWHPNGQYLLIETNRLDNSEIFLLEVNKTGFSNLTGLESDDQTPAWSRDGSAAALANNKTGKFEVHVVPIENGLSSVGSPVATGQAGRPVPWPGQG